MEKITREQILQFGKISATPVFLLHKNKVEFLNEEAEVLHLTIEALILFPWGKDVVLEWPIELVKDGQEQFYKLYARHIFFDADEYEDEGWLIQAVPSDNQTELQEISRISKARKIMFDMSSGIDRIETDHDIYDFILDSCSKAVEYSEMCSLMKIDNGLAHVVAKRGYSDSVYQMYIEKDKTFIGLETKGRFDHSIMINNLEKYYTFYNRDRFADERGFSLKSTLATPIHVNGELFAILCFDSIEKNAFSEVDEELLDLIKADIEAILTNHSMHREIMRLSITDNLTGLYNRCYLQEYMRKHYDQEFYIGMLDMNDLKGINDNHGHASGDTMLKAMAAELTNAFPGRNVFFRIGGDEFLGVLFDMESEEIEIAIKKLRENLKERPYELEDGEKRSLSFSFGFALHHSNDYFHNVMKIADNFMYKEKKSIKKRHDSE